MSVGESAPSPASGTTLEAERAYLRRARAELARMREHTLALSAQGGDPVSSQYLAAALWRRAAALVDDPAAAPFFGRIDLSEPPGERWYIGRRHIVDQNGDPLVIDWRAEVSRAFYRASRSEPMGVRLRRRFGLDRGAITAYEDERLVETGSADAESADAESAEATPGGRRSAILAAEIERPRIGPMRDIVATIQPEQDEIVRADVALTLCVQGAPGTGKTAVGLHRAAWLLYAYRERLARSGVLVVGPSAAFLEHVGAVLPALGEIAVDHTTLEALTARVPVRHEESASVGVLKGDARLAAVLQRAVWSALGSPTEALVAPRGSRRWRVPAHDVREIIDELRTRGVHYNAARAMLRQRLAHAVLLQLEAAGDSPDDRVQDAVARSRPVKAYADSLWPRLDPAKVVLRLLSDAGALAAAAQGILTDGEQRQLLWDRPPRSLARAPWSPADAVLVDEVAGILDRTPSLGHVVLDEAQDLSPMQLRAVGRRCSTGSMTVLGDIAQGTTAWATRSWAQSLAHLGQGDGHIEELTRGFRVPSAVIDFAARLLPYIAPQLAPPVSVRDDPGRLDVVVSVDPLWPAVLDAVRAALVRDGSLAVIVADAALQDAASVLTDAGLDHLRLGADHEDGEHRLHLVGARLAKGLEFDRVVVVEPAAIAAAEPDERTGLRRLYVVLTRAVTALTVVHAQPLPPALAAATH